MQIQRDLPLWEHVWQHFGYTGFEAVLGSRYFHARSFPHSLHVISMLALVYGVRDTTTSFRLWPSISHLILRKIFTKFGVGILHKTLSNRLQFLENLLCDRLSWRATWIPTRYVPHLWTNSGSIWYRMLFICVLSFGTYSVSQKEWTKLRESVPYVKIYRYNPKHLYPKLNGYGDNGQRSLKVWQLLHTYWLPNSY